MSGHGWDEPLSRNSDLPNGTVRLYYLFDLNGWMYPARGWTYRLLRTGTVWPPSRAKVGGRIDVQQ